MTIGLGTSLTFFCGVAAAQRSSNGQEFARINDDRNKQRVELKGDLTTAMRRASDAVDQANQPRLTDRLKQLSAEAAKLTRILRFSYGRVDLRPKVDSLVRNLEGLEADALSATERKEDRVALLRSHLEERLTAAVAVAKSAAQNRDADAQKEIEEIASRSAVLKSVIRDAGGASDLQALQRNVAEIEDESQRISTATRVDYRQQSDVTRLVAGIGLLTSTASAVILTFLFLRIRQRIEQLSAVYRRAAPPRETLEQTGGRGNVQISL